MRRYVWQARSSLFQAFSIVGRGRTRALVGESSSPLSLSLSHAFVFGALFFPFAQPCGLMSEEEAEGDRVSALDMGMTVSVATGHLPLQGGAEEEEVRVVDPEEEEAHRQRAAGAGDLHLLPVAIAHSGQANVSAFFRPVPRQAASSSSASGEIAPGTDATIAAVYTAHFHGRELSGKKVPLPEGCTGMVVEKSGRTEEAKEAGAGADTALQWRAGRTFDEFCLWNRDAATEERDDIMRNVAEWGGMAEALHGALSPPPEDEGKQEAA